MGVMSKEYTLKELEGVVRCECGSKYWRRSAQGRSRSACIDCGVTAPSKPETTKSQVKSDFRYIRLLMSQATKLLNEAGDNDDPRLGSDIDIKELSILANDLVAAASTLSQYVYERGGTL